MCACIHMFVHAIFFSFFHSILVTSSSMGRPLLLFMRAAWRRERKKQARRKKSEGWCSSGKLDSNVLHISCTHFLHWQKQHFLPNISNKINNKNKVSNATPCEKNKFWAHSTVRHHKYKETINTMNWYYTQNTQSTASTRKSPPPCQSNLSSFDLRAWPPWV